MHRKLFLTFLGTSNYEPVCYFSGDINCALPPLRFVQEATIQLHCRDFEADDEILVFTTELAYQKNWLDYEHKERDGARKVKQGLQKRLESLGLPCRWSNIHIANGESAEEIWEIFTTIFEKLQDGDQLYFDITHGFRSIPMLNMVLTNYAKLLKGVVVKGIYYGAFEHKVKNAEGEEFAPIWDLTSFSELQDWSTAAYSFIKSGNTAEIIELTNAKIAPTLRETKGQDATARSLRRLSIKLVEMDGAFVTNRGSEITDGKIFSEIRDQLEVLKNDRRLIRPLRPILERLESKIQGFATEGCPNWLAGAIWCFEHNLIQQGYTQLQEGIITQAILETKGIVRLDYTDYTHREIVKQAFFIKNKDLTLGKWLPPARDNVLITKCFVESDIVQALHKIFMALTNLRNDINHSGYTNKTSSDRFAKHLKIMVREVEDYFCQP